MDARVGGHGAAARGRYSAVLAERQRSAHGGYPDPAGGCCLAAAAHHEQTGAADAYDAVYAVKAAAEKEDVKADMDVADICAALEKGMTEITLEGVTGDEITWTEDGEPNKAPKAVEIKDGAYAAME